VTTVPYTACEFKLDVIFSEIGFVHILSGIKINSIYFKTFITFEASITCTWNYEFKLL